MSGAVPNSSGAATGAESESSLAHKQAFEQRLRAWMSDSRDATIGDVGSYGGRPFEWVKVGGEWCHLNADSTRAGISDYLSLVRSSGEDLPWYVVANNRGRFNKIAFGHVKRRIRGFYLYTEDDFVGSFLLG